MLTLARKHTSVRRKNDGVTLFEILIAIALFAIIVGPVLNSFVSAVKINAKGRDVMTATDIANSIMEGISGKAYQEVADDLVSLSKGIDVSDGSIRKFSGINDDWYNDKDHCYYGSSVSANLPGAYLTGDYYVDNSLVNLQYVVSVSMDGLDEKMAEKAISDIYGYVSSGTHDADFAPAVEDPSDKRLYFGFNQYPTSNYALKATNTVRLADPDKTNGKYGAPALAYMLYTRIEKNNHYYDATVTFVPRPQNGVNKNKDTGVDDFFVYEVTVRVYEYTYDAKNGKWESRFDGSGKFDGVPIAVLTGGIPNRPQESSVSSNTP